MSSSSGPSPEQAALMSNSWSQQDITQTNTAGVIGMYSKGDIYTFYMYFRANDVDEWWTVDSATTYGVCCQNETVTTQYTHISDSDGECCFDSKQYALESSTPTGTACSDSNYSSYVTSVSGMAAGLKNFRVMFQVGDEDSDWQGLKYQFLSTTNTLGTLSMNPVSYTDSVKTSYACNDILDQAFFDSDFYGSIEFSQGNGGTTGLIAYIER